MAGSPVFRPGAPCSLAPQLHTVHMQTICFQDMHMLLQSSQGSSSWGAGSLTNSHHLSVPPQPPPRFSLVGFNNFFCSVADPGCLSRILTISHHLSVPPQPPPRFYSRVGFNNFFCSVADPGGMFIEDFPSRIRIKEFKYFNSKTCF